VSICANCHRELTEDQSSMSCLCRPQFDALRADNAELRATIERLRDVRRSAVAEGHASPYLAHMIDQALDSAPDPRRVETAEELDALPDHTVIRDADEWVFEKLNYSNDRTGESFWAAPAIDPDSDDYNIGPDLPATVLWTPEGER
jgi:hypothetical protein